MRAINQGETVEIIDHREPLLVGCFATVRGTCGNGKYRLNGLRHNFPREQLRLVSPPGGIKAGHRVEIITALMYLDFDRKHPIRSLHRLKGEFYHMDVIKDIVCTSDEMRTAYRELKKRCLL